METIWGRLWAGSITITALLLALPFFKTHLPGLLDTQIVNLATKLWRWILYPYAEITFAEYVGENLKRSEIYAAIEGYLGEICPDRADRLKAEPCDDGASVVLSMENHEEVAVEHQGIMFWWSCNRIIPLSTSIYVNDAPEERRFYRLTFHRRHRCHRDRYIEFFIKRGKDVQVERRERKLYTNASVDPSSDHLSLWNHVPFKHPATFKTLAMDEDKKRQVMEDLVRFSQGKDYYASVGKPWKRGYLLYGPPGTGKSTMIAAMANFLKYDVYDLELTSVKDNTALRKLLIGTKSKSIIMIEDIDCSLDLSERIKKQTATACSISGDKEKMLKAAMKREGDKEESKVTLSGLLNFIDGLWSTCDDGERIIVLTTNHVEKLDPALLRRGRMDMRVEMSCCSFQGFKTLAKNYLGIEDHPLFDKIRKLLEVNNITPADVAENLMPKLANSPLFEGIRNRIEEGEISLGDELEISLMPKSGSEVKDNVELIKSCLDGLIETIENGCKSRCSNGFYSVHSPHTGCIPSTQFDGHHPIRSDPCNPCAARLPSRSDEWLECQPTRHDGFGSSQSTDSCARALCKPPWRQQPFLLNSKRLVNRPIDRQTATGNSRQIGPVYHRSSVQMTENFIQYHGLGVS